MGDVRKIGTDIGFGSSISAEVSDKMEVAGLPSVVGRGNTDTGLISVGLKQNKLERPFTITWEGHQYLVGPNVHLFAQPIERLDFFRLSEGPELRSLIYASLWRLLGEGTHYVALMIGLPISIMQDAAKAKEVLRQFHEWLLGEHHFSADGQSVSIIVTQVKVAAQPVGSFLSWGVNLNGKWQQRPEARTHTVGVCDIGFNTVDLLGVAQGQIVARFTGGSNLGMHRVADFIVHKVEREFGFTLSLYQADRLMRDYLENGECVLYHTGTETVMNEVVNDALDEGFARLNQFIRQYWEQGREFRHFLVTGGGAQAYRKQLIAHYPQAHILPNSVTANAEGLAKLAARSGTFKDDHS